MSRARFARALVPSGLPRMRRRGFGTLHDRPVPIADIAEFASKRQTGVNMQALLSTGMGLRLDKSTIDESLPKQQRTIIQVAQFLHHELPIRLAHRAMELEELPHGLSEMPSVRTVRDWYVESFNDLMTVAPPGLPEEEVAFEQCLHKIYDRHAPTLLKMARGVHEFKISLKAKYGSKANSAKEQRAQMLHDFPEVHSFLDAFYVSRIGIRILIGQYLELHHPQEARALARRRACLTRLRAGAPTLTPARAGSPRTAPPRADALRGPDQHEDVAL
jgi:pyruvate dehydrogenase kinase 2/3/4